MKLLTDLLPVILFVIAYQMYDIYMATIVLMGAIVAQIAFLKLTGKPVEKMHWITLVLVIGFGGLTLGLRDPQFIMWKPTVINWMFAAALLLSAIFMQRGIMRRMLDTIGDFPHHVVTRLNWAWAMFLFSLGVLNLYVAYNFAEETWVNFKLFGLMGLSLVFVIGQSFYLARHMQDTENNAAETAPED
jgi:intracellular septation protein